MTSPTAALTWEIWRRHRSRLSAIVIFIFVFALLYPKICALLGLDLNSPNALDTIASTASDRFEDASPISRVFQVITLLFLLLGPVACMVLSLLYVVWIFTFAQLDSKKGFGFPARIFTLPVSTNFLASWFLGVGVAVLTLVYLGWTYLVHLPKIDVFDGYPDCLAWVTLLVVAQAIMWALDGFPAVRVLLLCAAVSGFAFLTGPSLRDHPFLQQNQTFILVSFLALGCAVAFTGLSKIRHGAWQRWTWKWPRQRFGLRQSSGASDLSSGEGKAPEGWRSPRPAAIRPAHGEGESLRAARSQITRPFRSPAQAQFWFEWHARAGKLFYYVCGLSGAALLLMSIVAIRMGSLSEGDTNGLCIFLLAVPLFIHLCHGITPERNLPTFIATHPLISGDIVMAKLKTAALSSFLSWVVTVAMLCVVPLLGDVPTMLDQLSFPASYQLRVRSLLPVIVLALMFLTWRFVAADLYFGWSRTAWSVRVAALKIYVVLALGFLVAYLARSPRFEATFFNTVPFLLAFLILLKLVLAQWAFRASLKRQLLARSTMLKYLAIWLALAAALLIPTVLSFHHEPWILSLALGIILLLPLARIGFSPLALALGRHR